MYSAREISYSNILDIVEFTITIQIAFYSSELKIKFLWDICDYLIQLNEKDLYQTYYLL